MGARTHHPAAGRRFTLLGAAIAAALLGLGALSPLAAVPADSSDLQRTFDELEDPAISGEIDPPPAHGDPAFEKIDTFVVGSGHTAARAACAAAESRGYDAQVITAALGGEARKGGAFLAAAARTPSPSTAPKPSFSPISSISRSIASALPH